LIDTLELTDKPYTILSGLEQYFEPKKNLIIEQFKFFQRNQQEGESFDHFLIDLRKQSKKCEFGELNNNLLRVRIVLGINDKRLQERLLREPKLTLEQTVECCRAAEAAKQNQSVVMSKGDSNYLSSNPMVDAVIYNTKTEHSKDFNKFDDKSNGLQSGGQSSQSMKYKNHDINVFMYDCKKCGRHHGPRSCPAFNQKCKICLKFGHFAVGCKSRIVKDKSNLSNNVNNNRQVRAITNENNNSSD
ncbi:uncharacterized protein LOC126910143, partial [Daktulosphaira vitifoliae]|uniref:uncharacterized protein LOC126910143 n=1 Tax=Daktulosphaira vitifoliae TaxID=58002 RepID=UPI0021AA236A